MWNTIPLLSIYYLFSLLNVIDVVSSCRYIVCIGIDSFFLKNSTCNVVIKMSDEVLIIEIYNAFNIVQVQPFRKKCEINDKTISLCWCCRSDCVVHYHNLLVFFFTQNQILFFHDSVEDLSHIWFSIFDFVVVWGLDNH